MAAGISQWTVRRRYREFAELHKVLLDQVSGAAVAGQPAALTLPPLPGKRIFGSSVDPAFVQERREGLQVYLRKLCAIAELWRCSALVNFLDVETSMLAVQTQVSGAFVFATTILPAELIVQISLTEDFDWCETSSAILTPG